MLEKGWNSRLPRDTLRKCLIKIYPTASSFNIVLDKVKHHAKQSMDDAFDYAKQKWDKSHKNQFSSSGMSGELENKNPTFPVSLIRPYQPVDKEFFPLTNTTPLTVPPMEQSEDKKIKKSVKERILRGKNQREYLVRYRNPVHEDEWLAESEIPDSNKLLRIFRQERRPRA
ncbi:hypothetical protein O181_088004 [Austropuccinia psidii MF-1]|uniref:Chromo domain-containing protein n=1 Tax=Austropuccinia psidii MF-1 TaxID=1389203 RepID=A0A9Q3IQU8_9BASI|nr:hypothetical protein [Austropuccinia psidii MF-1]